MFAKLEGQTCAFMPVVRLTELMVEGSSYDFSLSWAG